MTDATQRASNRRDPGSDAELQAYHDGELAGVARWRFERRLRRSPDLQRALSDLARVGDWVREAVEEPSPDLWDAIALRLPAEDARRDEVAAGRRRLAPAWWAVRGAVAATAVLAIAFATDWFAVEEPARVGVVRWLDSGGRDVMVLEGEPGTTIIWVIDGADAGARRGGERESV